MFRTISTNFTRSFGPPRLGRLRLLSTSARVGASTTPMHSQETITSPLGQQTSEMSEMYAPRDEALGGPVSLRPKTALFFPGQGVQKVGMLKPWIEAFPHIAIPILQECDHVLQLETPLSRIMAEGSSEVLSRTENAQPAIFIASLVIHRILELEFGFSPRMEVDYMLGQSLGEFTAMVAAHFLRLTPALRIVRARAEATAACTAAAESRELPPDLTGIDAKESFNHPMAPTASRSAFGMVALLTAPDYMPTLINMIREVMRQRAVDTDPMKKGKIVQISNINSSSQIVLSGHLSAISDVVQHIRKWSGHDPQVVRLNTTTPFHTVLMKPAEKVVRSMMTHNMLSTAGTKPVISNITAREFQTKAEILDLLPRQITQIVNWAGSIRYLKDDKKVRRWIGVGPSRVGGKLIASELNGTGGEVLMVSEVADCEKLMRHLEQQLEQAAMHHERSARPQQQLTI